MPRQSKNQERIALYLILCIMCGFQPKKTFVNLSITAGVGTAPALLKAQIRIQKISAAEAET